MGSAHPESTALRKIERKELRIVDRQPAQIRLNVLAIRRQGIGSAAQERFWSNLRDL
ncbi:hypothetical protein [Rhizobium sp. J15]|uniref:hypothetical protein n=1 Tax=Rhizobium sp. J15 TaxID=2035450 RepID=UPI001596B422|nr:hypothetical protein [Rhizobium sp. J15]